MHTDYPTLSAFADGDLDPRDAAEVTEHLRWCAECRAELQFIRRLGEGLRALPTPSAPPHLIDEIFPAEPEPMPVAGGGAPGEPEPAPVAGPVVAERRPVARRWGLALAAGVAGLLAGALFLTFGADRAMAGSSMLTLDRIEGGAMTFRYETVFPLAAEPAVRARMRYWIPDPLRFAQNEGRFGEIELSRRAEGRFEGLADLPPGAVYAVATVEDLEGAYLDSDFGRFWEYLETDAEGRPTLDARRYQILAALELNAPRAAELAREAAAAFPDQPEFWFWNLSLELAALPEGPDETLRSAHAARLGALDRAARAGSPGPVEMHALSRYARLLDRPDLTEFWQRELGRRHPHHGAAALVSLESILPSRASSEEKLEALEEDWARAGAPATAQLGLQSSYELADPSLTERWLERYEMGSWGRGPSSDTEVARNLMEVPALWPLAEAWILDRLNSGREWVGSERRLDQSRHNFLAETRQSRAQLFLSLSRIRLDRGDLAGGIDALERSVEETWDPRVFVRAAEIHRSLGSDERAAELISLAAVDPVATPQPYLPPEDDAARIATGATNLFAARAAMRERIFAGLLDEYVNLHLPLRTGTGEDVTLEQATGVDPGVTLIVHTIRPDLIPDESLRLLRLNSDRLASAGATVVLVSEQESPPSGAPSEMDFRIHYDPEREVWNELRAWRSVQYFVLDRDGRLRHRGDQLADALRISLVLAL